jgi:hypothetical protein
MAFNGRNSKTNFMQETKMGKSTSQGLDQFDNQAGKNIGLYMSENETPETKSKEEGNQKHRPRAVQENIHVQKGMTFKSR